MLLRIILYIYIRMLVGCAQKGFSHAWECEKMHLCVLYLYMCNVCGGASGDIRGIFMNIYAYSWNALWYVTCVLYVCACWVKKGSNCFKQLLSLFLRENMRVPFVLGNCPNCRILHWINILRTKRFFEYLITTKNEAFKTFWYKEQ